MARPLLERVRAALADTPRVVEKRMFGGTMFLVGGKMCISVRAGRLMCRIDPAQHDAALARPGVTTVRMRGHDYRGFVHVRDAAVPTKRALDSWVTRCLKYNKQARSSKQRGRTR